MQPKLYIMCGLSASGKSTIARTLSEKENCIIISSDAIRGEICEGGVADQSKNEEVFNIFHKRIKENLSKGNNVIADATNITVKSRKAIFNAVRNIDCCKIAYVVIKSYGLCLLDNRSSSRKYPVPDEVIYKQMCAFQIPFYEEGFDKIILYTYDSTVNIYNNIGILDVYREDMFNFNQNNPHHNQTLYSHCMTVRDNFYKSKVYSLAAEFHDIGKLFCETVDEDGISHYYNHSSIGTYMLLEDYKEICYLEKLSKDELLEFLFIINYHMLPMNWTTDKSRNKWKKVLGEDKFNLLVEFNRCDKIRI